MTRYYKTRADRKPQEISKQEADKTERMVNMAKAVYTLKTEELAQIQREGGAWDADILEELCRRADMEEEWDNADGESFEAVAYAAAKKLGVEID